MREGTLWGTGYETSLNRLQAHRKLAVRFRCEAWSLPLHRCWPWGGHWRRCGPVAYDRPRPKRCGQRACHAIDTWQLGGIGGNWLAVGQPNVLNRDDRAVFRFDIRKYLNAGKVAKARLRLVVNPQTRGETFRLEHFAVERIVLAAKDLGSTQVKPIKGFEVKHGTPAGLALSFDVTDALNRDLETGFGFVGFRLVRSEYAELVGNPDNSPSLITIVNGSLWS